LPFPYTTHYSTRQTPQSEPIPGSGQVPNNASGFSFAVDDWVRLDRFLVLGAEGGSYYVSERTLTKENAGAVLRCLDSNPERAVNRIVQISEAGRAPKNDPAVFALALAAAHPKAKELALELMPRVCRIGTWLFQFIQAAQELRGWGRALRSAVAKWYTEKSPGDVAYQAMKYQKREGMSHRDVLRLCHVHPTNDTLQTIFHWIVKGWEGVGDVPHPNETLRPIWAFEKAKRATDVKEIARLIRDHRLPRECVPTQCLNEASVWEALLPHMGMTAMIRSLAKMTAVGLIKPMSDAVRFIRDKLADEEYLHKARIHPLSVLAALKVYQQGHGERGSLKWAPEGSIVDALDRAFYATFQTVRPTGKRWLLALDVSGSMCGPDLAGMPGITPRIGSAAMALVTAATERDYHFAAFTTGLTPLSISPRQRLDDVVRSISYLPFGGTDCSLPMVYALQRKLPVDVFTVYTDSETWAGSIHPVQALRQYRERMNIPARLIVVGMVSSGFTVADPADSGMMDVVGFDAAVPQLIADFMSH
jgi:60 kDa SS-A/Ro ribonucleoprotein